MRIDLSELDTIAPLPEDVTLSDGNIIEVGGIPAIGIPYLGRRFPDLVKGLLSGGIDLAALANVGPEASAAMIAAGCGKLGDEKDEKNALLLSAHDQLAILEVILRRTMPRGPGPFVEVVTKVMVALNPPDPAEMIKRKLEKSLQKRSQASSNGGAEMPTPSGDLPPDRLSAT